MTAEIFVGSIAVAKRSTAVCFLGELGVCYEVYELEGRPGYSFIFETGRHDGFSPDDVELVLNLTGRWSATRWQVISSRMSCSSPRISPRAVSRRLFRRT